MKSAAFDAFGARRDGEMLSMKMSSRVLPLVGLLIGLAGQSQALTITTVIGTTGTNSADATTNSTSSYARNVSATSIIDAGGSTVDLVGNSVNAQGRYAASTAADAGILTNNTRNATHAYQITFTITAPVWTMYDVTIDTARIGALTRVDDGTTGASANIGAVSGTVNAVANASLALAAVSLASGNNSVNTPFNQTSSTITLTGLTGNNNITLAFTWTSNATSNGSADLTGADEVAVRLGLGNNRSGTTVDNYPGAGSRVQANDGHFAGINATITAIPEPGTLLLMGSGLAGIAVFGRRRKS